MSRVAAAIAVCPSDAVEMRIVRYRLRISRGQAVSEWAGDAFFAGDGGPSDGPKPLRTSTIHWITAAGVTLPYELADQAEFDDDELARLIAEARRRNLRVAIWNERNSAVGSGSMEPGEAWFTGAGPPVSALPAAMHVESAGDRVTVEVDEQHPPHTLWLIAYPLLLVSFAWVFFLVMGGLGNMLRDIWAKAMIGRGQRFVATLDGSTLRIEVERNEGTETSITIDRARLVAFGVTFGFTAYTQDGAVELPNSWATLDLETQNSFAPAITSVLNQAIGAN